MTKSAVLSVRVSARVRDALEHAAATHDAAGASAMARDILERWAEDAEARATRESLRHAVSFLQAHHDWDDEPAEFFPAARKS